MKWSELTIEERDRLVHERVMGKSSNTEVCSHHKGTFMITCPQCHTSYEENQPNFPRFHSNLPSYSTNIDAAMSIVASHKFLEVRCVYSEGWKSETERWQLWGCILVPYEGISIGASAPTLPEAICCATLGHAGVTIESEDVNP